MAVGDLRAMVSDQPADGRAVGGPLADVGGPTDPAQAGGRFRPVKLIEADLGGEIPSFSGLDRYGSLQALIRLHGRPLGLVTLPLTNGRCSAAEVRRTALKQLGRRALAHRVQAALQSEVPSARTTVGELVGPHPPPALGPLPSVSVAICTRNRAPQLERCLTAVEHLHAEVLEVIVVDNAPSDDTTERLVRSRFPAFRYLREPRPGLDWARNRAVIEAAGEVIAFTDDDVVVDGAWVRALAETFAADEQIMAVTGLVVPFELETEAQALFERYGGFGRGFQRRWHSVGRTDSFHIGAGRFGTGANMAFRRRLFDLVGPFDTALDVGTVTKGGGDLEMFFRTLEGGHTLVYEPSAIVHHQHRRTYEELRTQLTNNGIGFYSFLVRSALAHPSRRASIARFGLWWLWRWSVRRLLLSYVRPAGFPRELILAELWGSIVGLGRYPRARRQAARIARATDGTAP